MTSTEVTQNAARAIDRRIRLNPEARFNANGVQTRRIAALVETACMLLCKKRPRTAREKLHRLDKADTRDGLSSLNNMASMGVPYATLLYERLLGRPFAGHRDSVSELVGDSLEAAVEGILQKAGISFRKTKRAEQIRGFDQAPDFMIPSEFNPKVVIEAKLTEDDGTARDKVTRIQHLEEISNKRRRTGFQVVACIGGRGFAVRRNDMAKLIRATGGKVFTLKTLDCLIAHTQLRDFRTK